MTFRLPTSLLALALLCSLAIQPKQRVVAQAAQPVLVVVSSALGVSDISLAKLRQVFEGTATELNGRRLIPFNLMVGTTARAVLDKVLFGLTQERIPYYWIDRKVREGIDAPRVLPSREMALRVAASLKGAIAYVDAAPSIVPATLRVLSIDGIRPTAPDYPLCAHTRE
jgi:hypothetical protein